MTDDDARFTGEPELMQELPLKYLNFPIFRAQVMIDLATAVFDTTEGEIEPLHQLCIHSSVHLYVINVE
jgi:hypothetical protein